MASNKSLAEYNLTQEPTIRTKRETLAEKHRHVVQYFYTKLQEKEKFYKMSEDSMFSLI